MRQNSAVYASNKERSPFLKVIKAQRKFKDTEGFNLLESTELAIYKRKLLLNRLFVTQSTPNETRPKTRPALKCDSVFVPIKSCISTTYLVSRPVFDGSY